MKTPKPQKSSPPLLLADTPNGEPSQSEIAFTAYLLWERQGCPPNCAVDNWVQAEAQLRQARRQAAGQI